MSYLNPAEVAEELGVSRTTVYRLTRAGKIAALQIGTQYRYTPEAVLSYKTAAAVVPTQAQKTQSWKEALKQVDVADKEVRV